MSGMLTVLAAVIGGLSVIGLWSLLHMAAEWAFPIPSVLPAVLLRCPDDVENLPFLLDEALRHRVKQRGEAVMVLVNPALLNGFIGENGTLFPVYARLLREYGAVWGVECDIRTVDTHHTRHTDL